MNNSAQARQDDRGRRSSRRGGFVLIEVMASVVILSVGLLTAFSGIRSAQGLLERAENVQKATAILDELMSFYALHPAGLMELQQPLHQGEFEWITKIEPWDTAANVEWKSFVANMNDEQKLETVPLSSDWQRINVKISWEEHGITRELEASQLLELGG